MTVHLNTVAAQGQTARSMFSLKALPATTLNPKLPRHGEGFGQKYHCR